MALADRFFNRPLQQPQQQVRTPDAQPASPDRKIKPTLAERFGNLKQRVRTMVSGFPEEQRNTVVTTVDQRMDMHAKRMDKAWADHQAGTITTLNSFRALMNARNYRVEDYSVSHLDLLRSELQNVGQMVTQDVRFSDGRTMYPSLVGEVRQPSTVGEDRYFNAPLRTHQEQIQRIISELEHQQSLASTRQAIQEAPAHRTAA